MGGGGKGGGGTSLLSLLMKEGGGGGRLTAVGGKGESRRQWVGMADKGVAAALLWGGVLCQKS